MQLETLVVGELATNCYIVWCERTNQAIVIDPADSGDYISQRLLELQLTPVAVVLTHGHFDHILGLLELSLNFPQAEILGHRADLFLIESAAQRAQHWLHHPVDPVPLPTRFITEGDRISFGEETLTIWETPGHTPGSLCAWNNECIFTGDTLFYHAVGRTDFSYSSRTHLKRSLKRLTALPTNLVVYPGHGETTLLSEEYLGM